MRPEPRLLMYAAGVAGVGQTRRAIRLEEYVRSAFGAASALVVTSVPDAAELFGVCPGTLVASPAVIDLVTAVRTGVPGNPAAAAAALLSLASEFEPDVFVTTTHAGVAGELRPLLQRLGQDGCRRVLALRDVYWPSRFVEEFERLSTIDFDGVVVGGPPETSAWTPAGLLDGALGSRVRFAGYLRPIEATIEPFTSSPLVRCQVGGGRDGYALAAAVIELAPELQARQPHLRLQVSTGPYMSARNRHYLSVAVGAADVVIEPWITDPFGSDPAHERPALVVSMAGYNACVEAAWFGTPTILCPRRRADDSEQEIRARLFEERFENITVVDRPDPADLLRAMDDPPKDMNPWLDAGWCAAFADPLDVGRVVVGSAS